MLHDALVREHDVIVSAPKVEQSGIGHAFTFNKPLSYENLPATCGMNGYAVGGTPSDCVKFAVSHLLAAMPDLVISGMNLGENSGISSYYSGTVAAAREGAFWRLPSVAFSVCGQDQTHLEGYCQRAVDLLARIIASGPANNGTVVFYNVNFPNCSPTSCKGIKVTRQSCAFFDDRYRRIASLRAGVEDGFMVYGDKKDVEPLDTFDSRALMNNFITVTPLSFDATAEWALPFLAGLEQENGQENGNG
jgi:5'-nucleotidase